MAFISYRRALLDEQLKRAVPRFKGSILDVGGSRHRRGEFQIPEHLKGDWKILNRDPRTQPDIVCELPEIAAPDASYDQVIMTEVLEYIPDYHRLLDECHRVLRPGGLMFISFPFLSPLHGDHQYDSLRLTGPYFEKIIASKFEVVGKVNLGGPLSVFCDCLRSRWYTHGKTTMIKRIIWKLLAVSYPLVVSLDRLIFRDADDCSTGPWYILRRTSGS